MCFTNDVFHYIQLKSNQVFQTWSQLTHSLHFSCVTQIIPAIMLYEYSLALLCWYVLLNVVFFVHALHSVVILQHVMCKRVMSNILSFTLFVPLHSISANRWLLTHLCVCYDWLAAGLVGVACRVLLPLAPGSFSSGWCCYCCPRFFHWLHL